MVCVRSVSTVTLSVAGKLARNLGNSCCTRSTTSITLAPGWRWIFRTIDGVSLVQAACRGFSGPWVEEAICDRRIGAPFL